MALSAARSYSWRRTAAWTALAGAGLSLAGAITAQVIREQHRAVYNVSAGVDPI